MGRRGIHIPPPMRAAEMLERRFGVLIGRARDLALEILVPAIASGDQSRIADALTRIDNELAELSHIAELERMARDTADRASKRHGKLFMAGLAAAVGMAIKGSDDGSVAAPQIAGPLGGFGAPPPLPPGPGLASGGPKRIKGILVAKLSAEPSLLAHQFATENARRIKSLSDEVVPALRDEVVRAVTFGYDHEEAAARLQKKWARSGVPVAKGNLKPRVGLIVRDQVAKLNSKLTSARSRAAGIARFYWTSQRDSRVRPLHRTLDNGRTTYEFGIGHPTEGEPGDPPLCRCYAVPAVDAEAVLTSPGFIAIGEGSQAFSVIG